MESGYFFVGDLLGFSRIVENLSNEACGTRVKEWIRLVEDATQHAKIERFQLVSDSVFAVGGAGATGLEALVKFSRFLLEIGTTRSLPVRGGISFGSFSWGKLTFGQAVVACHELERRQHWVGVACSSSIPHVAEFWSPSSLVCYPPPSREGQIKLQPVVVWSVPELPALTTALTSHGLTRGGQMLDWDWAGRIGNTIQFRLYLKLLVEFRLDAQNFHGVHPMQIIEKRIESMTGRGDR